MVRAQCKVPVRDSEKTEDFLKRPGNDVLKGAVQAYSRSGHPVFRSSVNAIHQSLLRSFSKINITPENADEARDQRLLHLVMCRVLSHDFPLDVLLTVSVSWREALQNIRTNHSQAHMFLTDSQKRLLKFVILLYERMCSLKMQYKLPRDMPLCQPSSLAKCTVVVCGYCYELLTYFGTAKRPASFGWFFETERMEHRCYRDDSDHLHLVRLADPETNTRLSISMPDRPSVSACVQCLELVDGERQLLCTSCDISHAAEEAEPIPGTPRQEDRDRHRRSAFFKALQYEQDKLAFSRLIR